MRAFAACGRLVASLLLLAAMLSMGTGALAQEPPPPQAEQPIAAVDANPSVGVNCGYDANLNQSNCTFTASSSAGAVDAVSVASSNLCAPVVAVVAGTSTGGGYQGAGSVTLVLQGNVSVGSGATTYGVTVAGNTSTVSGPTVACAAPAPPEPIVESVVDVQVDDGDIGGEELPSEALPPVEVPPVGDDPVIEQPDTPATDDGPTGELDPSTGEGEDASLPPAPADDGTGAQITGELEPAEQTIASAQVEPVVEAAALISIPITAYNCESDPGAADPAVTAGCAPAQGVTFHVTQNDVALPSVFTDGAGAAAFDAEEGANVVIQEDLSTVATGFLAIGNGQRTINPVAAGAGAVFVHVNASVNGRLQIASGECPTSGEARTEFRVVGAQQTFGAADTTCHPTPGVPFTLLGGTLPPEGQVVTTDNQGSWRGFLAPGVYTIVDESGVSESVNITADNLVLVIVVDYIPQPEGTLLVTRFLCTEGEEEVTTIVVDVAPGVGGPGCALHDSAFRLSDVGDGTSAAYQDFTLGPDGVAEIEITVGDYVLTDLASKQQVTVTVAEGSTTAATVRQVVLTGRAVVRHFYCEDPASSTVDPTNAAYFAGCDTPLGGVALTLLDAQGGAVATESGSGGGVITWSGLTVGTYSVVSGSGLCAAFVGDVDARGGFDILVNQTTLVEVYTCATPIGPGDDDDGSSGAPIGQPDGGADDGAGGGNLGIGGDADANELMSVTQLPNTGAGPVDSRSGLLMGLGALIVVGLVGRGIVVSKRQFA